MTPAIKTTHDACIICGESDKKLIRGLCPAHHAQYLRARKAAKDPQTWEEHLIANGMLLRSKQGTRLQPGENPFEADLLEFEGVPSLETAEYQAKKGKRKPADQAASELVAKVDEEQKSAGKGSKGKRTKKKQ